MKGRVLRVAGINYQSGETPTVSITAEGRAAEESVALARELGVPLVENGELAKALQALELDQEIPSEMYEAVARVLIGIEDNS